MKKTTLLLTLSCLLLAGFHASSSIATVNTKPAAVKGDWMKSRNGAWAGDMNGVTHWYKLDQDKKLWWSMDKGKNWSHVESQMWQDKSGKWMKVEDKNVVWSNDMGKTWTTVPDWTWQGSDGKWYKFDKDWMVWEK